MARLRDSVNMNAMAGLKYLVGTYLLQTLLREVEGLVSRVGATYLTKTDVDEYEVEAPSHLVVWCLLVCSLPTW